MTKTKIKHQKGHYEKNQEKTKVKIDQIFRLYLLPEKNKIERKETVTKIVLHLT